MLSSAETCQLAEEEICTCLERQRARLEREAGLRPPPSQHFYRPVERAFTAEERGRVTILLGGLTWKHEQLIRAVMEGCGYRCQTLPQPSHAACELGREYGNVGQCNPSYYTVGSLLQFLRQLEAQGLSRKEILDRYVLFTVGSCGPCRFGMYESEYRLALCNAGFKGFRVLLFQQTDGIKASSGEPGLKFSMDFGLGIANAFQVADVLNDVLYRVRPYEVNEGETNRVFEQVLDSLGYFLRDRERFEILERTPPWFSRRLAAYPFCKGVLNGLGKMREHFRGRAYLVALEAAREQINAIEVDRTRVKPLVKIVGEFWAQTTEGEGNFNMFAFLEREGAQVLPEPISTWVMYLIYEAKALALERKGLRAPAGWGLCERLREELKFRKRWNLLSLGENIWLAVFLRGQGARRAYAWAHPTGRAGATGTPLLPPAGARRRGALGSRQEHLLHHAPSVSHDSQPETVRVPSFFAVRWRAGSCGRAVPGDDLSPDRDFAGRGNPRPQSGADGPERSAEKGAGGV